MPKKINVSAYFKIIAKDDPEDYCYMEYKICLTPTPGHEDAKVNMSEEDKATELMIQEIRKNMPLGNYDVVRVTKEEHDENTEPDEDI